MSTALRIKRSGLVFRLSLFVLTGTTLIFLLAFGYNYYDTRKQILADVMQDGEYSTQATLFQIQALLEKVEREALFIKQFIERHGVASKQVQQQYIEDMLKSPDIYGTALAYEPYAHNKTQLYRMPYCFKDKGKIKWLFLGSRDYNYFLMDWYQIPKETGKSSWSEPYFDEGAGNIVMSTYSVPIFRTVKGEQKFMGVVTVDLSRESFLKMINKMVPQNASYAFLLSQNGVFVVHPNRSLIMKESIFSIADETGDANLRSIGMKMVHGGKGLARMDSSFLGQASWMYYAPIPSTGWSVAIIFPEHHLFASLYRLNETVLIIGITGFVVLFIVIVLIAQSITRPLRMLTSKVSEIAEGNLDIDVPTIKSLDEVGELSRSFQHMKVALKEYIHNLAETTAAKERIESELKIARTIQMSFLPKQFPHFPDKDEFELFAVLESAREVGGDFYEFFLLDEDRLFFSVGDVSGKGVPAALFMAVSKTLLKGIAYQQQDPGLLLEMVNRELSRDNDSMMFVTVFCGLLNYKTGKFVYSNAGHNPPIIMSAKGQPHLLAVLPGFLLGVQEDMKYETDRIFMDPGDTIFLYTDGVTEAMNEEGGFFTEKRLLTSIEDGRNETPETMVHHVMSDLKTFTGNVPQSDDITILAMTYRGAESGKIKNS